MLLLYPGRTRGRYACTVYLHSTMLLLYLALIVLFGIGALWFTFHYASTLSACDIIKYLCGFLIYIPLCFYFIKEVSENLRNFCCIYIPLCFYFIPGAGTTKSTKFFIYIPLCFYFMECRLSARQVAAVFTFHYASTLSSYDPIDCVADFIYIPLCFYFIKEVSENLRNFCCIYIPLCFYFIPGAGTTKSTKFFIYIPLCFYFMECRLSARQVAAVFTFHYASTLSSYDPIDCVADFIYIPLCFYFILLRSAWQSLPGIYLHSTMLLLYPIYGPVTNPQVNIFTFHYASTLSRSKALFKQTSCIYIPLCFYFITFGRVMRWHRIRHLHSTMLLLYPVLKLLRRWPQRYLHSTMLLLYP